MITQEELKKLYAEVNESYQKLENISKGKDIAPKELDIEGIQRLLGQPYTHKASIHEPDRARKKGLDGLIERTPGAVLGNVADTVFLSNKYDSKN